MPSEIYEFNICHDNDIGYYIVMEPVNHYIVNILEANGYPFEDEVFLCYNVPEARVFLKKRFKENKELI